MAPGEGGLDWEEGQAPLIYAPLIYAAVEFALLFLFNHCLLCPQCGARPCAGAGDTAVN